MDQEVKLNDRGERISRNKNGYPCVFFGDRKPDFLPLALSSINQVAEELRQDVGIELFIMYGSLLGPVRAGDFIPHDDDFDYSYVSKGQTDQEICAEAVEIAETLRRRGYKVSMASFGFMQVQVNPEVRFDLFVGWERDRKFHLYWGIPEGVPIEEVAPLRTMSMHGVDVPVPNRPESLLEKVYGPNWRTPDPGFRYTNDVRRHPAFRFLIRGWPKETGRGYWQNVYARKPIPQYPSQFAVSLMPELERGSRVLDIGCGNGRDALFFASQGLHVLGADAALSGLEKASAANHPNASFEQLDLYKAAMVTEFTKRHSGEFDVIYARFFLHAISEEGEKVFWRVVRDCAKAGARVYIEARTINDLETHKGQRVSEAEVITDHYRRFIITNELHYQAKRHGFELLYQVEGTGLAKFRDEDPPVLRATYRKKVSSS